jgi:NAD(P)H-dependent FMN reductase
MWSTNKLEAVSRAEKRFRMKNILIIQGGGRPNGNTAQLVEHFARGAKEAGHTVEVISLRKQEVKGCMGCNACRYGKPCVQKDSFNELVPKIKDADCIVFASPLLFWTISAQLKALIERFYCIAEEDPNPPLGRYEKYPSKDCALLMTSADNFFWTFEQAVSYYQFTLVNYIGFHDRGMLLAGGCGDTNGKPQIDKTDHLQEAYEFGKHIY